MPTAGSVTGLLEHLRAGDHEAAPPLWERYYPRWVGLARQRLRGTPRRRGGRGTERLGASLTG
jgi:hypothetical protein